MLIEDLRQKRDALRGELETLRAKPATTGTAERIDNVARGLEAVEAEVADAERRLERVRELSADPAHCEGPTPAKPERRNTMSTTPRIKGEGASQAHDSALRSVDAAYERDEIGEAAGVRCMEAVRRDKFGIDARYVTAISDPHYRTAFAKQLAGANGAAQTLTADEQAAVLEVGQVMQQRAMSVGEGAGGGFALPIQIDPTIQISSDGALSPLRDLATTHVVASSEWRGVTSEGITAEFAAEGSEVADGSPELAQPKGTPERAHAFAPFSLELGQDWSSLAEELQRLFGDAKNSLEASKFLTGEGAGENEPAGLLNEVAEPSVVETATKEKTAAGDVYSLKQALPPRFQGRGTFLSSGTVADAIHRFSGPASEEPALFSEDRTMLLGKRWHEISDMSTEPSKKNADVLVYGDLGAAFAILDRLGMTVETVPHLFGENQRPTGQRGLYLVWRTTSLVQVSNAFRVLRVKPE